VEAKGMVITNALIEAGLFCLLLLSPFWVADRGYARLVKNKPKKQNKIKY